LLVCRLVFAAKIANVDRRHVSPLSPR
jgi:hypothetical protein